MEHWEYILLVFAVGAMHRRWLGLGNSGPRWIKLVSMALFLLVMFDPYAKPMDCGSTLPQWS